MQSWKKHITLFDRNEPSFWVLQPTNRSDGSTFQPRPHFPVGGKCGNINECHGNNVDLVRVRNMLSHPLWSNIFECFQHYCGLTGKSYFCISEYEYAVGAYKHSSALSINTVQVIHDLKISCAIEMTEQKLEEILNLKCMWKPKFYGIVGTIILSDTHSTVNSDSIELGLQVMNISPWTLFERKLEAHCSINIPNQICNFSLYITPWVSYISLGESIELTCSENSSNVTWKEISSSGVLILNVSEATITYHASKIYENGVIIMCSSNSGNRELVQGIGKVIVRHVTQSAATTVSSSTELDFGATITVHAYADEDLILTLLLTSFALLFSVGMFILFIKYEN